ncbi:DEAD/DEAH box helicase [Desulfosediminicola ganghwensis]|uniref:DEAD/DEAH box helicase n=1 Tax=Desulfosediminicola ganghwensis TaxID=2569540 RepID=UPI0010AD32EC|nr:DEAD/DEAH box helicase [Desulfosediminicola ganghwensis]
MENQVHYAPGARVVIRDAEWLVRKVDRTSTGGQAITVVGISELVKDKEAIFLSRIDTDIEILDPVDTKLVQDTSSAYQASMLYMESLLRRKAPTDASLYAGHKAAMDLVPYQLDPAIQALKQPRQRILIADAVGLGKTLASGILMSELIRRGRGKRILVLVVKSMLTQFQKEMWSRFTIPLVRLDSVGINRVRNRIPTNHNPFYYYDKAIVSIDTLKQDTEYRTHLENAYWDIIVIDEAHNVAERGNGKSQRAKLANLLADRSDTLIMLSATPHDGKARSFASLMNMLDPTAIANPEDYGPEDIKGLYIRRFKKDIQDQVQNAFKPREISKAYCQASPLEEQAFDVFARLKFARLDQRKGAGQLFKTTLEKALLSSPAACLQTINNRLKRLENDSGREAYKDIESLTELAEQVEAITPDQFAKYQKLVAVIKDKKKGFGWSGKKKDDRLVIFTERIETLRFLEANLTGELGLKEDQVEILHGSMADIEQQRIVEDFGKEEAKVRLLIASDVASEGINLHYLSHRLIHFDIPWSLMVFQQRNGRVDRYGQEKAPQILYLVNQSENPKIKGDMRILELLITKDEEAVKNIGDPSALMGVYDIDAEEKITADAMERGLSENEFGQELEADDPLSLFFEDADKQDEQNDSAVDAIRSMSSLYQNDYHYLKSAVNYLREKDKLQISFDDDNQEIELFAGEDLKRRLKYVLPREVWPEKDNFILSAQTNTIQNEIKRSRKDENAWPNVHYLWEQNPLVEWINDKVVAGFGRHEAPVLTLPGRLAAGEVVVLLSALIPNRKGQPLLHYWLGVNFNQGIFQEIERLAPLLARTGFGTREFPNPDQEVDLDNLKRLLPEAVKQTKAFMTTERASFEEDINTKLQTHLDALEKLKGKQYRQLDLFFEEKRQLSKKEEKKREIDRKFDEFMRWVEDSMTTEDNPFIQVIAVLKGDS